jgi:hypothetical protein
MEGISNTTGARDVPAHSGPEACNGIKLSLVLLSSDVLRSGTSRRSDVEAFALSRLEASP